MTGGVCIVMSMTDEKTREIMEYLEEVRKVISPEHETETSNIYRKLDFIFDKMFWNYDSDL
ncbi:MAG: hypothetical protein HeimC2_35710 [Candidatus Heimdallarchaeota archaeon LC_2]|nr:MAG: hypothetical protein HeimC2_35710 [Candidatus Heimdallarchaeota archaeon LC_2]